MPINWSPLLNTPLPEDPYEPPVVPPTTHQNQPEPPQVDPQERFRNWNYRTAELNPDGEELPDGALGWRPDGEADFGTGFEGWWKKAYSNIQDAWFKGWDEGAKIAEEKKYQTDLMPRFTSSTQAAKAIGAEAMWGALSALGAGGTYLERVAGTIGFELQDRIYGNDDKYTLAQNWEASRLTYSHLWDMYVDNRGDAIREEFVDRMEKGERPDLIAEDMQIRGEANPWAEMGGQLIFDPLNADLFVNWFGKARRTMKVTSEVTRTLATVESDVVREVIEGAAKGGDELRAADSFRKAFEAQRELVGQTKKMVGALQTPGYQSLKGLPSRARGVMNLTPNSRRLYFSNRMGAVVESIARSAGTDDILDIMDAMAKVASGSDREAAEAFAFLSKSKHANVLMSQAGNELSSVMGAMLTKYGDDWLDAIRLANREGGVENVAAMLMKRLGGVGDDSVGVLDDLFPSAKKMLDAADEARTLIKEGKEVPEATRKLADMAGNMNPVEKAIARMHNNAQAGIVGKLNRGFATVYMNWSPAFAFRNGVQNNIQLFLDYGPAAYLKSADELMDEANKLNKITQHVGGFTQHATATAEQIADEKTGYLGLVAGLKRAFKTRGFRGASEAAEMNAGQRIYGHTYKKTFRQALDPLMKDMSKKFQAQPELWDRVKSALYNNYGNVDAALNAVREELDSGVINLFKSYDNLPKGIADWLQRVGKDRDVIDTVLRAQSKEEALTAANKIFSDLKQAAQSAYLDGAPSTPGDVMDEAMQLANESGYVSSARGMLISAQQQVNNETISTASDIVMQIQASLSRQGYTIPPELTKKFKLTPLLEWGTKTSDELRAVREAVLATVHTMTDGNFADKWVRLQKVLPLQGTPPPTKRGAISQIWDFFLEEYSPMKWAASRGVSLENVSKWMDEVESLSGVPIPDEFRKAMDETIQYADQWRDVKVGDMGLLVKDNHGLTLQGTQATQIAQIADHFGVPSAGPNGVPRDKYLLSIINKYSGVEFKSLTEPISLDLVQRAFAKKMGVEAGDLGKIFGAVDEATAAAGTAAGPLPKKGIEALVPPYRDGTMPTYSRMLMDSDMDTALKAMTEYVDQNFGKLMPYAKDAGTEGFLKRIAPELERRLETVRVVSQGVAKEARDFTLLNYGQKTYWDMASAYLMPYGFWYKGTYSNWMKRIVANPAIMAGYGKYKDALATSHAGLPDWWKNNIEVNNVFGVELDHPLFFNLEATLWPLNGITGEDFNDPARRVDWWTVTMDEMGKFGPSIWTPISILTGLVLRNQGDQEASDGWLGRLIPQTALVKTLTGKELDPVVGLLQGGYDKYERRRIGRGLAELVSTGEITQQQAIEAARTQEGQAWEMGAKKAMEYRKVGQTLSSLFGVGFKMRSQEDMAVDQFYNEYRYLMTVRANMSPDDFRDQMALLGQKYQFMDTVLIANRAGEDRDTAYAYNVLARIPPGDASELLQLVGVENELVNRFYENKGNMSDWTEGDRLRFMGAMVDIGAIRTIPDYPMRKEWNDARSDYSSMMGEVEKALGADIWSTVDDYYAAREQSTRQGELFMQEHPEVSQALDLKRSYIVNNPLLNMYYGGIETIQSYYESQARADLRTKYGDDIYEVYYEYMDIIDAKQKNAFKKANPRLEQFIKDKNAWKDVVNRKTAELSSQLPEAPDVPVLEPSSPTQDRLIRTINAPQTVPAEQLIAEMSPALQALVQQYWQGQELPYAANQQLDYIGSRYGLDGDTVLQIIGAQ